MDIEYRLPESVITVEATIERVTDTKAHTDERDLGSATADVVLSVRGDVGAGQMVLSLGGGRGDNEFTVQLTADQRLTAVSYKSVGVGSRVVAASATVLATVAGIAVQAAAAGSAGRMLAGDAQLSDRTGTTRRAWRMTCAGSGTTATRSWPPTRRPTWTF